MRRLDFWKSDWFFSIVVALLVLIAADGDLVQSLERKAYDLGVQAASRIPSDRIAVIAIDDRSIAKIGRWPWPRELLARMTDTLAGAQATVIGFGTFFFDPQIDPGLAYINKLMQTYEPLAAPGAPGVAALAPIGALLTEAEQALNTDRRLGESIRRAGNVVLPMTFNRITEPLRAPDPGKPVPEYVAKQTVNFKAAGADVLPLSGAEPLYPLPAFGTVAAAIGHLAASKDPDGALRSEPLFIRHRDKLFPSFSLVLAARSLNLGVDAIKPVPGEAVLIGNRRIGTDTKLRMNTFYYTAHDGRSVFPVDSFVDVHTGKIPAAKYADKIVLIGATASGLTENLVTPVSSAMPPLLAVAHAVASILNEHYFVVPRWGVLVEKLVFLLVAVYLIALLPRLKAAVAGMLSLGFGAVLLIAHFVLMVTQLMWIPLMAPVVLLAVGYAALICKRFMVAERGNEKSDPESACHRMPGLACQGQNPLDTAFDYFRRVPLGGSIMDRLYRLGLDFQRKRQFNNNKAESVFRDMADFDPKFRDLDARLGRAKAMSETVIAGAGGGHPRRAAVLPGGASEKPMLGRYQVEKELGRGATGVVYLGRDPKIGRVVAIKTMALSPEFEGDGLADVKERFFREAESAGRLTHANIVTIYDVGEEHDLAFIAMEFLKGRDLTPYVKADALLPLPKVLLIVARVADALSYAHANGIVHRDIKPANIMYEPESDTVKVTDFGIARATDSSKTTTGMVLGTPSYMSPEQLAGKKVEGPSDIFSLGVTLYQLASGRLPFEADTMARLMYRIANDAHPDVRAHNPRLPAGVAAIVNKTLAKDPDQRYPNGELMARALRLCLGSPVPAAKPTAAANV